MRVRIIFLLAVLVLAVAVQANAAVLEFTSLTKMTKNGTNFNLSVYDGKASYQPNIDTGSTAVVPIGDGTLLDWKLLGGSNLNGKVFNENNVGYANGPADYINNPTSTTTAGADATITTPYSYGKVWYNSDPGTDFSNTPADLTAYTVLQAGATAVPNGPITGTVNIATLESGQFYIFAGGYQANTDYILSLSGPGQTTLNATKNDVINTNNNRVNSVLFTFTNPDGLYDTLTWTYKHNSGNIRGRFMGVALDGVVPEPATMSILALGGLALLRRRRSWGK
jgi:hypothetical protein